MNIDKLREQLKIDEGVKYEVYKDHLGYPTFGIGHLVVEGDEEHGKPVGTPVSAMSQQAKLELQDRIVAKAIIEHEEIGDEDVDVFDEVEDISPESYEEKEKVTSIAIDKFMGGNVKWKRPT